MRVKLNLGENLHESPIPLVSPNPTHATRSTSMSVPTDGYKEQEIVRGRVSGGRERRRYIERGRAEREERFT